VITDLQTVDKFCYGFCFKQCDGLTSVLSFQLNSNQLLWLNVWRYTIKMSTGFVFAEMGHRNLSLNYTVTEIPNKLM
jgi:hypothetical protein